MMDANECRISCGSPRVIVQTVLEVLPELPSEIGNELHGVMTYYLRRYGEEGFFARVNNRTVAEVIEQYREETRTHLVESAEKEVKHDELHEGLGNETSVQDRGGASWSVTGESALVSLSECTISCSAAQDIASAIFAFFPRLASENRRDLIGLIAYYEQRYGEDGLFARVNKRTLAEILQQYHAEVQTNLAISEETAAAQTEVCADSSTRRRRDDRTRKAQRRLEPRELRTFEEQIAFRADDAGSTSQRGVLFVGTGGGGHYLVFQRDLNARHATQIYLEYDDQSFGGFDAISQCILTREELRITLSRQLGFLKGTREFVVSLAVDDDSFNRLRAGLRQVFEVGPGLLRD